MPKNEESGLEYWHNTVPMCPHCDYQDEEWWDGWGELRNDQEEQVTCPSCSRDYMVTVHYEPEFTTDYCKSNSTTPQLKEDN